MKFVFKYYLLIALAVILLPLGTVFASDITNAKWLGIVTVSNNSSSVTNICAVFSLNSTSMINQSFCNSSLTDVAMFNTSDDYFMPGYGNNPWCLFVPNSSAGSNVNYDIYAKGAVSTGTVYFPGDAGMSVSDNANMEWGSSGNLTIAGRFEPTSTGNIYSKTAAMSLGGDGAGNIAGAIFGASGALFPSIASSTNSTGTSATSLTVNLAPSFAAGDLSIVVLSTYKTYVGGDATITPATGWTELFNTKYTATNFYQHGAWYKVLNGSESATQSWSSNASVSYSSVALRIDKNSYAGVPAVGTTATGVSSNPDPPSLTSGFGALDTLWLATCTSSAVESTPPTSYSSVSSNGSTNYYTYVAKRNRTIATEDPGTFTSGVSTWEANTIAIEGASSVRVLGVLAAAHTFNLSLSGGIFSLQVDSNTPSTVSYAGNVTNNANAITFCTNGIMPYVSSIQTYAGGILSGSWAWQFATTFTDLSGYGNTGTPTFRTTSSNANISANVSSFQPVSQAEAASSTATGNLTIMGSPTAPSELYTEGNFNYIPGGAVANAILDASGTPRALWWYPFLFLGIALLGMMLYGATTGTVSMSSNAAAHMGSLLLQSIVSELMFVVFAVMGAIPLFPALIFPIGAIAVIMSTKHYGYG